MTLIRHSLAQQCMQQPSPFAALSFKVSWQTVHCCWSTMLVMCMSLAAYPTLFGWVVRPVRTSGTPKLVLHVHCQALWRCITADTQKQAGLLVSSAACQHVNAESSKQGDIRE